MSNGKGSKRRPLSISQDEYADNWDHIFKKKDYEVEVKELDNGEQYIELPDELMEDLVWKEGDEIEWSELDNGFELKKKR